VSAPARPIAGLASRVAVYEMAALGDAPGRPDLPGCEISGATIAAMAVERRRDGDRIREVLSAAGVSL